MSDKLIVRGAGGKPSGGDSRPPVEAPDSLYSIAYARILDLISEGEIAGLVDGLKSIYLDETPLMNADGTLNFKNVQVDERYGTPDQEYIPGFPAVEAETIVGIELKDDLAWTQSITNLQLSALRVRLSTSGLSKTSTTTGDITGHRVDYAIDLKVDSGAYVEVFNGAFAGKTTNTYERSHRIDLPPATTGWLIRVRRLTPNSTEAYVADKTFIQSYTTLIDAKMRYPYSALVGIAIDASQFRSIPRRSYDMLGMIIQVPVNYNPITREYTGIWNGTFKMAWTNNPAWIYYAMVTNPRYGLGSVIDAGRVDKWSLYKIAQYCDVLVPDGLGGMEPRFTCTVYLQRRADAYKVLQDLASVFRGLAYWGAGQVIAVADMPEDPVYTYTNANVKDGKFVYQGSGRRARHSVALVAWSDPDDFGRGKIEYVEDPESLERYGLQETSVTGFGCTSQSQARRIGKWILYSERLETDTVNFTVGLDGTLIAPGKIIRVADADRVGKRVGGRISASTSTTITVDKLPTPDPVAGDFVIVTLPTGLTEKRTIASVNAGTKTITMTAAFSALPVVESIWAIESTVLYVPTYRVLAVTESEKTTFGITALRHEPQKFDAVELGLKIETRPTSVMPARVQAKPTGLVLTAHERAGEIVASPFLLAEWLPTPNAMAYMIQWQKDDGEWTTPQEVLGTSTRLDNIFMGIYSFRLWAVNAIGITSPIAVSAYLTVGDQTLSPGFVAALSASIAGAIATAEEALDLAAAVSDGGIQSYFQDSAPTGLDIADVGDLWFDSDDGNKIYRWSGSAWVAAPDSAIAIAIAAAATAQATADGKVKTFIQASPPSATGIGDLWIDSDDGNKLYRAAAVGTGSWVLAQDTGIGAALAAAANAQATADGSITSFWQNSAPTIGSGAGQAQVGDIWFDTDDGNKVWRVVGAAWVDAQDDALAAALAAASTAQATADGKVKTFFAPDASPPTASGIGDLWFKTTSLVLVRWNGTTWGDIIGDVTLGQLAGTGLNMLWDEYTQFRSSTVPALANSVVTAVMVTDSAAIGGYSLKFTTTNTSVNAYSCLAPVLATSIHPINGTKFIVSFYARASVSGHKVAVEIFTGGSSFGASTDISITNTTGLTRYSAVVTGSQIDIGNLVLRLNKSGVTGRDVYIDRIMVEPKYGNLTTPSPWVPGSAGLAARAAQAAAATAQAAADGVVDIYRQSAAPTFGPAKAGDYWQDSDDNKWYYSPSGSSWTEVTDPRIPQAIIDAAAAQTTANSRIRTFYASSAPTPTAVGDLWYNTATSVLSRWDGSAWINVADNSIAALNPNVVNPGFEQGLLGWSDPYGYGLSGWASSTPATAPSGTKIMVKSGGTTGSTGLLNDATVAVTSGDTVMVRATVKADSNPVGGVEIGMAWYSATGSLVSWSTAIADFTKDYCNGVWKEFIKAVQVPGGAVLGKVFLVVHGYTAVGSWSFDSIRADTLADASAGLNIIPNSEWIQNLTSWTGLSSIGTLNEAKYAVTSSLADNTQGYIYADLTTDLTASIGKKVSAQCEFMVTGTTSTYTFGFLRVECFDVSNASLGYKDSLVYGLGGTTQIPITADTWNRLTVNGLNVPTGTTKIRFMLVVRGRGTFRFRKPKLERGEFATAYSPSADIVWGSQLTISGSGMRVGDQRNLLQSLVNAYGAVSDAVPITATSAGAVSINAFNVKMGGSSVSYNAVSNAVTGLTVGVTYNIYCFDAAFAGGTRTWYASSGTYAALMSLGDDIVVAGVVQIPASGSAGGGSGGSDPGGDPDCVHWDTYLPDGRLVRDLEVGDMVTCIDMLTMEVADFPVLNIGHAIAPCYRLVTPSLCSIIQSAETAMNLPHGGVAKTTEMLGRMVVSRKDDMLSEEVCTAVQYLGELPVIKINLGDRMLFAGESPNATIATHNLRFK